MEIPGSLCKKVKLSNNAQNWVSGGRRRERGERRGGCGSRGLPGHPGGAGGGDPGGGCPRRRAPAPELSPRLERPRAAAEAEEGASLHVPGLLGSARGPGPGLGRSPRLYISELQCAGCIPNNVAIHESGLL